MVSSRRSSVQWISDWLYSAARTCRWSRCSRWLFNDCTYHSYWLIIFLAFACLYLLRIRCPWDVQSSPQHPQLAVLLRSWLLQIWPPVDGSRINILRKWCFDQITDSRCLIGLSITRTSESLTCNIAGLKSIQRASAQNLPLFGGSHCSQEDILLPSCLKTFYWRSGNECKYKWRPSTFPTLCNGYAQGPHHLAAWELITSLRSYVY